MLMTIISSLCSSREVCLYSPISDSVNLQLEAEPSAIDNHFEREVEIVEFHTSGRREPCEQTSRYGAEVRG